MPELDTETGVGVPRLPPRPPALERFLLWTELGDPESIEDWLSGTEVPNDRSGTTPGQWLASAVRERATPANRQAFAARLAAWFNTEPEAAPAHWMRDRALANALDVAGSIPDAPEVFEALHGLFLRQRLDGEWDGIPHRFRLAVALAATQIDNRMLPVWEEMYTNGQHAWLGGSRELARVGKGRWEAVTCESIDRILVVPVPARVVRELARKVHAVVSGRNGTQITLRHALSHVVANSPGAAQRFKDLKPRFVQDHQHSSAGSAKDARTTSGRPKRRTSRAVAETLE